MDRATNLMNTNPKAKTILCYGDSNTWGRMPDRSGRYDAATRWPGQLQKLLGDDFYVIEEGLGGRTTNLDDPNNIKNGLTYLVPCLKSHEPIDYLVIMLGTNDFKTRFHRSPADISNAVRELLKAARECTQAKIIILSPAHIDPTAPRFMEFYQKDFSASSGTASQELAGNLEELSLEQDCQFIDTALVAKVGEDGLHIDHTSHAALAKSIFSKITV